jgi:hypothetical protein
MRQPTLSPKMRAFAVAIADVITARLEERFFRLAQPPRRQESRLLSLTAAARWLGVDRKTTLLDLIHDKRLRTVLVGNRCKVPLVELERIEWEGTTRRRSNRSIRTSSSRGQGAADVAAAIRAIPIR